MASRRNWDPRSYLLWFWLCAFIINLGMVSGLYWLDWIEADNFKVGLWQLSIVYSPYLGLMLVFYFRVKLSRSIRGWGKSAAVAAIASLVWNAIPVLLLIRVWLLRSTIEQALKVLGEACGLLGWLVGPAIAFYFSSREVVGGGSINRNRAST